MFSQAIQGVIKAFGMIDSVSIQSDIGREAVVQAADMDLCRIVPFKGQQVTLVDTVWSVTSGIELTERGKRELARR